jgi:hypothetical protein
MNQNIERMETAIKRAVKFVRSDRYFQTDTEPLQGGEDVEAWIETTSPRLRDDYELDETRARDAAVIALAHFMVTDPLFKAWADYARKEGLL